MTNVGIAAGDTFIQFALNGGQTSTILNFFEGSNSFPTIRIVFGLATGDVFKLDSNGNIIATSKGVVFSPSAPSFNLLFVNNILYLLNWISSSPYTTALVNWVETIDFLDLTSVTYNASQVNSWAVAMNTAQFNASFGPSVNNSTQAFALIQSLTYYGPAQTGVVLDNIDEAATSSSAPAPTGLPAWEIAVIVVAVVVAVALALGLGLGLGLHKK
jgi:hypothetical protein